MKRHLTKFMLFCTLFLALMVSCQATAPAQAQSFSCSNVIDIPQTECQELVLLYNSTNGSGWWDKSGWLNTNMPCSWYGITCSGGHVSQIYFYNNYLTGHIPNFSNLPNLINLVLSNNQLTGSIPNFTSLPNLTGLYLDNNQLTDNIPNFSNLPNLTNLALAYNQLTGSIPNFTSLPNLTGLYLYSNQLTGNIPNFSNLSKLVVLNVSSNQLTGIVPNLNWSRFNSLTLYNNCGLVAFDVAQAIVLSSKDSYWKVLNPTCSATSTPTLSNITMTATPTVTGTPDITMTATPTATETPTVTGTPMTATPTMTPMPTGTPSPSVTPIADVASTVIPPSGGVLTSTDGLASVQFPSGLITNSLALSITTLTQTAHLTTGFKFSSHLFEIIAVDGMGERVTQFNKPFTITFSYQDSDWSGLGQETDLSVYYWSETVNNWVNMLPCVGCSQDTLNNRFVIQLNHLTEFALLVGKRERVYLPVIKP